MLKRLVILTSSFVLIGLACVPGRALAAPTPGDDGGGGGSSQPAVKESCDPSTQDCGQEFIDAYISPIILALSGLIGVFAVISLIMAGIQYAGSADDPGVVTKAKQRIFATVIGIVAYIFLFAFLNYLVPGGILP